MTTKKTKKAAKKASAKEYRKQDAVEESAFPVTKTERAVAKLRGLTVGQVQVLKTRRGLSPQAIKKIPEESLKRAVRRLDYTDLARARENFRLLQSRNEEGVVPPNSLRNALKQLDSSRTRFAAPAHIAGVPAGVQVTPGTLVSPFILPAAGLNPLHTGWTSLGPGNIGGRTRSLIIHPTNSNIMWAGSVGGGVWRTDNAGQNWAPVDDLMANLAVTCMAIDPTNSNQLFAGTGEGFSNTDAIRGAGVFQTTDGTTWTQLPTTTGSNFQSVNRLAMSSNGSVLLAATGKGIFRSEDAARLTWTQVFTEPVGYVRCHPSNSIKAIAGGLANGQAYFSTDAGKTWKIATHPSTWTGRVELTYAARNPDIVYASVQMDNGGEIWRSTDGGRTYTRRDSILTNGQLARYLGDQGWYANTIWAGDPTNSDLVIVGGLDLYRSTNGGNVLTDISTWWDDRSAHADHHCIVSHPGYNGTTNKVAFFGNDGGIYKTDDITTVGNNGQLPRINGWTELNNTFGVTQFYSGAGNAATGTIIGGAQDNGTLRFTPAGGNENWTSMFGGDGGWCAADANDPNFFYGEYVYLNIHRSDDGGATSDYISGQFWNGNQWAWKPIPFRITDAMNQQALFIAPFVLDPNNSNCILGGGLSLWRTTNAKAPNTNSTGPVWSTIKSSIGRRISALAVGKGNSNLIWIGYDNGQVFNTQNGTDANPSWQRLDHAGSNPLTPTRFCTCITIDPNNHSVVYIAFGGYSRGNIWKTTDGGARWTNIGNLLPEAPIRAAAIHPRKSNFIYLGTEVGVFASEDSGATWSPTNEGPTNCSVDDLFWMNEVLVSVSHGRGMFTIDLSGA